MGVYVWIQSQLICIAEMEWTLLDKKALDDEYSPRIWSKRGTGDWVLNNHIKLVTEVSAQVRETVPCDLDVPYGTREGEKFDIFGANTLPQDAPVYVHIHGGYWQDLERCISSYCVTPLYNAGNIVVIIGYDLTPKVQFEDIIGEIQSAISTVLKWAADRGSRCVIIGGHSAGSHLTAMLLHSSWWREERHFQLIRGLVHISGVFDLTPLVETYVNAPLKLDNETAKKFSPMFNLDALRESQSESATELLKRIRHIVVIGADGGRHGRRIGRDPFGGSFRHRRETPGRRLSPYWKDSATVDSKSLQPTMKMETFPNKSTIF